MTDDDLDAGMFMGGSDDAEQLDEREDIANEHAADLRDEAGTPTAESPSTSTTVGIANSALPTAQLDALEPSERRRLAKKRGVEWPSTDDARGRLFDTIAEVMRNEDERVVDAPTSLGKSYTVATTRWGAREDITGDRPVIHLSATRDARDEAVEAAADNGGEFFVLQSRDEACPVAAGDHDPEPDGEDPDLTITIDNEPASEWIQHMCEGRGLPFSSVHRYLEDHNDQDTDLPCAEGCDHDTCPAIHQWTEWREHDWPLVIATHNFAHVPGIRTNTNLVFDERPDFAEDLGDSTDERTSRIRRMVTAYLKTVDASVETWEEFITVATYDGDASVSLTDYQDLRDAIKADPDREWYFTCDDAHTLAPAVTRALLHSEERPNGRRAGSEVYEPPRLEAGARDDDGWNREELRIVLDDENTVQTVRSVPRLAEARSVVGLDAHPSVPVWAANTVEHIETAAVLDAQERRLWRRYERGLRVVQVGDATRPLASGNYFDWDGCHALAEHLYREYGDQFRTAITAASVEDELADILADVGCPEPETMHYGEEKSRNDFATETVGFVNGSIDPGDDYIVNLLAELDKDAEPARSDTECPACEGDGCHECDGVGHQRAHGREFTGEDAETAAAILASVRENHTAQAAGRYARNPDDPSATATVFVRTDAMPLDFADVQVPGVVWTYGKTQREIVETLRSTPGRLTARAIADDVGCSKQHVHDTLGRLVEDGVADAIERHGPNGATTYADTGTPTTGTADLTDADGETINSPVWSSYTWALAVADPAAVEDTDDAGSAASDTPAEAVTPLGGVDWDSRQGG